MRVLSLVLILAATSAAAEDRSIIWMDSTGGEGARSDDRGVIWADTTGGGHVRDETDDRGIIWMDSTAGDGAHTAPADRSLSGRVTR